MNSNRCTGRRRWPRGAVTGAALAGLLSAPGAGAWDGEPPPDLMVTEATGLAVSASASAGPLVFAAGGTLWRVPRAGGEAEAVTPPEVLAGHPRVAADGRRVAYEVAHGGRVHLALLDLATGESRDLTSGDVTDVEPAWQPDGNRIVFASDRGGDFGIWELDLGQGTMRQLTVERGDEREPAPDPTGHYLAWVRPQGRDAGLHLTEEGHAGATLLVAGEDLHGPAWRPDGTVLTFVSNGSTLPRLQMAILSDPPVVKPASRSEVAEPGPATWLDRNQILYAADGRLRVREFGAPAFRDIPFSARLRLRGAPRAAPARLEDVELGRSAVVRDPVPLPDGRLVVTLRGDLWIADSEGRPQRALTASDAMDAEPALAPDGHTLAYTSDASGRPQVWVTDIAGGTPRRLTAEPDGATRPVWSPAGDRLAYQAPGPDGAVALRITALRGTAAAVTVATLPVAPGLPAFTPDGNFLAVASWAPEGGGTARLLLYPSGGAGPSGGTARTVTLLRETMAAGANDLALSPDGRQVAIASARGVAVLPVTPGGMVGPEWRSLASRPAASVAWSPDGASLWLGDGESLVNLPVSGEPAARRAALLADTLPAVPGGRRVIRAERVFDGSGYRYRQEIVVENRRIVAVRGWSDETEDVIDARGRTVLPGLVDALLPAPAVADARLGQRLLAAGITAVHFTPEDTPVVRALAEVWRAHASGPRVLTRAGSYPAATGPDAGGLPPGWSTDWRQALRGTAEALVRGVTPLDEALPLRQDAIDTLARTGVAYLPTIARRGAPLLAEDRPDLLAPGADPALAQAWRTALDQAGPTLRQWVRAERQVAARVAVGGGHVVAASGLSIAARPGLAFHAALALLAGGGLPPAEWLQTGLRNPARLLGLEGVLGCVAEGCRADLLIVDGDPLRDPADLLKLRQVIFDGESVTSGQALEKFTPPPRAKAQGTPRGHAAAPRGRHSSSRSGDASKNFTN